MQKSDLKPDEIVGTWVDIAVSWIEFPGTDLSMNA